MTLLKLIAASLLLVAPALQAQCIDNANAAFSLATARHQPVMLIFSGSDWCAPCIRFAKTILSDRRFLSYADSTLILLKADFPQRHILPDTLIAQNEQLAERYNPDGTFPTLVLVAPDHTVIRYITYTNQSPEILISELTAFLKEQPHE